MEQREAARERVAIVYGGWSSERDISTSSAKRVLENFPSDLFQPTLVEFTPDRQFRCGLRLMTAADLSHEFDVALLVLHGVGGEDGTIQGALEVAGLPYTGPGILASSVFMNKAVTKVVFRGLGVPTPDYELVELSETKRDSYDQVGKRLFRDLRCDRLIVKPASGGSSQATHVVQSPIECSHALADVERVDDHAIIEKFVAGREFQVGLMGDFAHPRILPVLEVRLHGTEWFDPEAKYGADRNRVSFHIPAQLSPVQRQEMIDHSVKIYRAIRVDGYARFDFLCTDDTVFALEVNTITGMTPTSTFPLMAQSDGISYSGLLTFLIQEALERDRYRGSKGE